MFLIQHVLFSLLFFSKIKTESIHIDPVSVALSKSNKLTSKKIHCYFRGRTRCRSGDAMA